MNPVYDLLGIGKILSNFEKNVAKLGWHKANQKYIKDLNIQVVDNVLGTSFTGSVIIYSNHPTGLDPYLISSIIPRDDLFFLGDIYQSKKGRNIGFHILPIYYWDWLEFRKRSILSWPGYIFMRITTGCVSKEVAYKKNSKSIDEAISYLEKGKIVLIFPTGAEKENKAWKVGLGKIILGCRQKNIKITLLSAHIKGINEFSLVRHFFFGRKFLKKSKVSILVRKIDTSKLLSLKNVSEINKILEDEYRSNKL